MQAAGINTTSMVTNPTLGQKAINLIIAIRGFADLFTARYFPSPQQWWWGPFPICRRSPCWRPDGVLGGVFCRVTGAIPTDALERVCRLPGGFPWRVFGLWGVPDGAFASFEIFDLDLDYGTWELGLGFRLGVPDGALASCGNPFPHEHPSLPRNQLRSTSANL